MKPALVLIAILAVLAVIGMVGYGLGQLGGDDSDQEVKAGLSDLASALAKIGEDDLTADRLQEFYNCSLILIEIEEQNPVFSESEQVAMTMVLVGAMVSMPRMTGSLAEFDQAMQKCAALN